MQEILDRNLFFVRQHLGLFKAACSFDIQDPETGEVVLECREDGLGILTKALRFTDFRRYTPFDLLVRTSAGEPVVHVRRGMTFFRQKVAVADASNQPLGYFRLRHFALRSTFDLLDLKGRPLCQLKGSLLAREFRFLVDGKTELAKVTKKWGGIGRELFSEADNYVIQIDEAVEPGSVLRPLILASALCIDMVLKR